jgi:hypothetical protein
LVLGFYPIFFLLLAGLFAKEFQMGLACRISAPLSAFSSSLYAIRSAKLAFIRNNPLIADGIFDNFFSAIGGLSWINSNLALSLI